MTRIAPSWLLTALLAGFLAGCVEQTAPGVGKALAVKLEDIQGALDLVGDGQARYEAEQTKQSGYQYCSLSIEASHRGQLRRAVELATMALYLGRQQQEPDLISQAARDLALALGFAGKLDESSAFARLALDEAAKLPYAHRTAPYTKLVAWRILGENLSRQGRHDEALRAFAEAKSFQTNHAPRFSSDSLTLAIANTHLRAGNQAEARRLFTGLTGAGATDQVLRARAERGIGDALMAEGKHREALARYAEAFQAARAADNLYERVWALERLGRATLAAGDRAGAIRHLTAAMEGSERIRARFRSEEFRAGFFGNQLVIYDRLMLALVEEGKVAEAFAVSERGRARALRDMMGDRVQVLDEATRRNVADLHELRQRLGALRADAEYGGGEPARTRAAEVEGRVRDIEARLMAHARGVDFIAAAVGSSITAAQVQAQLPPAGALLEYHVLESETLLWRIDRAGVTVHRLPIPRTALRSRVEELRSEVIARAAGARDRARELHTALLAPALAPHDASLVIVPHDVLHYLPFAALWDGQRYLVEGGPINILPSASVLLAPRPSRFGPDARLVAFGNPATHVQYRLKPLPAAEREVRDIARLFPATTVLTRQEASKRSFLALAPASQAIHVAAHAIYDDLDPLASAIFLAPDGWDNGRLEAQEVFGLNLRGSALASLSACQTGLGKLHRGDEVIGLSRAFLAAGVRSLALSLWSVDDDSTGKLMAAFYRELREASMPEALRRAQLEVLKEHPEPFFWAPFFVIDLSR